MKITLDISEKNEGTESPYWLIIDPSVLKNRLHGTGTCDEDGDCGCEEEECVCTWIADLDDDSVIESILDGIPHCITGPFFSREAAEEHLKARHYAFGAGAYVYCHSGYWSTEYKTAIREARSKGAGR